MSLLKPKEEQENYTRAHLLDMCTCGHQQRLHGDQSGFCYGGMTNGDSICPCDCFEKDESA